MKASHLIISLGIVAVTALAWFILGKAISDRTHGFSRSMAGEVSDVWGPALVQQHPQAWFATPNAVNGRQTLQPTKAEVVVGLESEPKRRGLFWHRTYQVDFQADYEFTNPTRIPQTLFLSLPLPAEASGLRGFEFTVDGVEEGGAAPNPSNHTLQRATVVPAGATIPVRLAYRTNGTNSWSYHFPDASRISGFELRMQTNFEEINFPVGTGSPTDRRFSEGTWSLNWDYPDVLAAPHIGMDMPKTLNAGPVAARIAFFAPVSLLFFVTVLLLVAGLRGISLHPMHIFFVSAGFFGFHLLFAYLVDLLPLYTSFGISALVSLVLVCSYLRAVGGMPLLKVAVPAQMTYLILFSFSFFFDGLTGIVLSVVSLATLALLMILTAKVDWAKVFRGSAIQPENPVASPLPPPFTPR